MPEETENSKILKKSSVTPSSHPDRFYYLNLGNGILYELNPELVSDLGVEVIDGSAELTNVEDLRKESLKIMDEYIRKSCS